MRQIHKRKFVRNDNKKLLLYGYDKHKESPSKEIDITVEFLDEGGNVLDTEAFTIEADPAPLLERQIAYGNGGRSLDILRNTTNIRVGAINQSDNSSTSSQPDPKIILRSSAEFRFRLK